MTSRVLSVVLGSMQMTTSETCPTSESSISTMVSAHWYAMTAATILTPLLDRRRLSGRQHLGRQDAESHLVDTRYDAGRAAGQHLSHHVLLGRGDGRVGLLDALLGVGPPGVLLRHDRRHTVLAA